MNVETGPDLFRFQLERAYALERSLRQALETLERDVSVDALDDLRVTGCRSALQEAIAEHRKTTSEHVARLEQSFDLSEASVESVSVSVLDGLIADKERFNNSILNDELRPVYYLAVAKMVESIEIMLYEQLHALAVAHDRPDEEVDTLEAILADERSMLGSLRTIEDNQLQELLEAIAGTSPSP